MAKQTSAIGSKSKRKGSSMWKNGTKTSEKGKESEYEAVNAPQMKKTTADLEWMKKNPDYEPVVVGKMGKGKGSRRGPRPRRPVAKMTAQQQKTDERKWNIIWVTAGLVWMGIGGAVFWVTYRSIGQS